MKRTGIVAVFAMLAVALFTAFSVTPSQAAEIREKTIKLAHVLPRDSNFDVGANK